MAFKTVHIPNVGDVTLYKRRGVRHIRLAITAEGEARVTMPFWAPYHVGAQFAASKAKWILLQQPKSLLLVDGQKIGKGYTLDFITSETDKPRTRIRMGRISVLMPPDCSATDEDIQTIAHKAAIRALKAEAERLLPTRLNQLSAEHGFSYKSVRIKRLKGRWGSCNQNKEIVLNCFLMQLPDELIDYVIVHELAHTQVMAHGAPFWELVGQHVQNLPQIRKTMRTHQPRLVGGS